MNWRLHFSNFAATNGKTNRRRMATTTGFVAGLICFLSGGSGLAQSETVPVLTNAGPRWLPLPEVLKKWEDTPVQTLTGKAEAGDLTAQHYLGYCHAEGFRFSQDAAQGIRWYERAGNSGYLPSLSNLGFLYQRGKGVPQDYAKAMHYYRLAAAGGFASGYANVGILYRDGLGVERDPGEALKWFRQAAEQNHAVAIVEIGRSYRFGNGVAKDLAAAEQWFRRAARQGSRLGQLNLGLLFEEDTEDFSEALKWYRQAAEQDDAEAMSRLYFMHWRGDGVPRDRVEAMRWLSQAAAKDNPHAQCLLGYRFTTREWEGTGPNRHLTQANLPEAVRWFRRSADQNWAGGQYYLALSYLGGDGIRKDEAAGLELMRKAADQHHSDALCELARLYTRNIGEPRSPQDQPVPLLLKAAEHHNREAYQYLAFRYQYGLGTEPDLIEAARWYARAAFADYSRWGRGDPAFIKSAGKPAQTDPFHIVLAWYSDATRRNPEAMARIGKLYRNGENTPRNLAKAWIWFELARQTGASGNEAVAQIEAQLNPVQLTEARRQLGIIAKELNEDGVAVRALAEATQ
jgi:TPR repeat protein